MKDLTGRVCILTGASRGIGAVLAQRLGAEGLKLALVARDAAGLAEVVDKVVAAGGTAVASVADLTELDGLEPLVERVASELGPPVVLINNAGVDDFQHFTEATVAGIARSTAINLTTPMVLTRLVVPHMQAAGEGQVVTMASVAGLLGTPYGAVYAATKAAIIAATHSLRMEYADAPFGFSAICPGFVHGTGMHEVHKHQAGNAPATLGGTTAEAVVRAVHLALYDNPAEVIVNQAPLRPLIGVGRTFPRLSNWLTGLISAEYMRKIADARRQS